MRRLLLPAQWEVVAADESEAPRHQKIVCACATSWAAARTWPAAAFRPASSIAHCRWSPRRRCSSPHAASRGNERWCLRAPGYTIGTTRTRARLTCGVCPRGRRASGLSPAPPAHALVPPWQAQAPTACGRVSASMFHHLCRCAESFGSAGEESPNNASALILQLAGVGQTVDSAPPGARGSSNWSVRVVNTAAVMIELVADSIA